VTQNGVVISNQDSDQWFFSVNRLFKCLALRQRHGQASALLEAGDYRQLDLLALPGRTILQEQAPGCNILNKSIFGKGLTNRPQYDIIDIS
jgi:hypothetical protein